VRVFALVGILVATAFAAFLFLLGRGSDDPGFPTAGPATPATTPVPATAAKPEPTAAAKPRPAAVATRSGFPPAIDRALRQRKVVVVAVYLPGSEVDALVQREAREGALLARAGFVAVSVSSERVLRRLVDRVGVLPEPAVLILRRPGVVATTLGVTDREVVAQAAANARR
jgi:hypothetical protein